MLGQVHGTSCQLVQLSRIHATRSGKAKLVYTSVKHAACVNHVKMLKKGYSGKTALALHLHSSVRVGEAKHSWTCCPFSGGYIRHTVHSLERISDSKLGGASSRLHEG